MKKSEKIRQQIAELQQEAAEARKEEIKSAIQEIRTIMADNGITMADLDGRRSAKKSASGVKLPAKYRDPATGKTWAGVGRAPKWVSEAEAAGKSRDEFLIKK